MDPRSEATAPLSARPAGRRPNRLARLAPYALALGAVGLGGAAWLALRAEAWGAAGRRLVGACWLVADAVSLAPGGWVAAQPWTALALGLLAASLLRALARLGLALGSGWRLGRRSAPYESGRSAVLDAALRLAPEVARDRVRVVRGRRPAAFTAGWLRPKVCLSVGLLERLTATELQGVLRHEQAHVRARDPLRLAALRLLADLLWFLPIARLLAERAAAETELRADDAAVAAGSDALALASAIVKTARGSALIPRLIPSLAGLPLVEERVRRLVGREPGATGASPWARALASGLIVATLLAMLLGPTLGTAGAEAGPVPTTGAAVTMDCAGHPGILRDREGRAEG